MTKGGLRLRCPKCGGAAVIDSDPQWRGDRAVCVRCGNHRELGAQFTGVRPVQGEARRRLLVEALDRLPASLSGAGQEEVAARLEGIIGEGVAPDEVGPMVAASRRWCWVFRGKKERHLELAVPDWQGELWPGRV